MFADFAFRGLTHLGKCVMPMNLRAHASELASALHIAHAISPETGNQLNEIIFERHFGLLVTSVFGSVLESGDLADECHLLTPSTLYIVFLILCTFLEYSMACRQFVLPLFAVHA